MCVFSCEPDRKDCALVEKQVNGWLFVDESGRRRKMGYYDPLLVELLER
jgi:hypothetical protein